MTTNDAAAVLEHIIEKRGAEWVASNWGLDREQLARWYEGQEELPPEMVLAMRVWVSAVKRPKGDVGCFEDSDHPPEVPEDVTETGWNAVPMPTVGRGEICISAKSRGELLWEGHRFEVGPPNDSELQEMVEMAWQAAGARYDVDVIGDYYWLVGELPLEDWPKNLPWDRLVDWLRGHICDLLGR
jgi:hypothetical protein